MIIYMAYMIIYIDIDIVGGKEKFLLPYPFFVFGCLINQINIQIDMRKSNFMHKEIPHT